MKLYGMEKLSLVDYDGHIASTVFTGACNFRCGFCHNSPLVLDVKSLQVISEEEVIDYLKKRKGILDGLCITGGEPTLNSDLPSFCEKVKNIGYNVKIDTNGTNPEMVKYLAENKLADYFAMDIKNDKSNYGEIIGIKNYDTKTVEKTVEFFLTNDYEYEFRTTLIAEYHKKENIEEIGKWIKGAKRYSMQKFKEVNTCISLGLHAVSDEQAKEFLEIIKNYVKESKLRGYDL